MHTPLQWLRQNIHDDVIKWKHLPRYWSFVRGIHWSPLISLHNGQWHGAVMFYLICVWINCWVNNREAGDLRRHHAHYDVNVMVMHTPQQWLRQNITESCFALTDKLRDAHSGDLGWNSHCNHCLMVKTSTKHLSNCTRSNALKFPSGIAKAIRTTTIR